MTSPGRIRDPEQRIRDIGRAAAELIAEAGVDALTHRAVAARAGVAVGTTTRYFATIDDLRRHALEFLVADFDTELGALERSLAEATDPAAHLAAVTAEALADRRTVLADCSLTYAGLFEEDLRELSLHWYQGLTRILTPYFGRDRSELMSMCLDGAYLNAALSDTPPSADRLESLIRAISTMPDVGAANPDTTNTHHSHAADTDEDPTA